MIIKCVKCKDKFEQKNEERFCINCSTLTPVNVLKKYKISKKTTNLIIELVKNEIRTGENSHTLKETYLELMNQLLKDGIVRNQISTVGSKLLIKQRQLAYKKLNNTTNAELIITNPGSWWFDVARENDFINPKYSHPKTSESKIPEKEKPRKCKKCRNLVNDYIIFKQGKIRGWSLHCRGLSYFILCCNCNVLLKDFLMENIQT